VRTAPAAQSSAARAESRGAPSAEAEDARPAIIFLGDSLTAGRGLSRAEAYPALLQRRFDGAGMRYRVVNAGRSGDTSAGGLSRLDWYFDATPRVAALVVALGSNDAMRGLALASMEENLVKIVERARRRAPEAKIFLWALRTFPNMGVDYAGRYAEVFPRVARQTGAELIPFPLAQVAGRDELNQADGIHPNAEGMQRVADAVWRALEPRLRHDPQTAR
jgi:acyl-CoA thioesterase-1